MSEIIIFYAWTGRKGETVFYGIVEEPNGKRTASNRFRRPASAISHARTIAMNINGDKSGGVCMPAPAKSRRSTTSIGRQLPAREISSRPARCRWTTQANHPIFKSSATANAATRKEETK